MQVKRKHLEYSWDDFGMKVMSAMCCTRLIKQFVIGIKDKLEAVTWVGNVEKLLYYKNTRIFKSVVAY